MEDTTIAVTLGVDIRHITLAGKTAAEDVRARPLRAKTRSVRGVGFFFKSSPGEGDFGPSPGSEGRRSGKPSRRKSFAIKSSWLWSQAFFSGFWSCSRNPGEYTSSPAFTAILSFIGRKDTTALARSPERLLAGARLALFPELGGVLVSGDCAARSTEDTLNRRRFANV